ncbi:hypothetical protein R50073_42140 [Maricurvus nonylphenolicus]
MKRAGYSYQKGINFLGGLGLIAISIQAGNNQDPYTANAMYGLIN